MDNLTDTTLFQSGLFSFYEKFNRLRFSGYIQPQFQVAQSKGAPSFIGGDFPAAVNNRFSLRRGRLRLDYSHFNKEGLPSVFFVFQFDGTERGFFTRDFWGRVYDPKWHLFNLTAGIFPRPFGFEINLGSNDRESPERGRMSQLLMRTERDIGAMVSFQPQRKDHPLSKIKADLGVFNGQGLNASSDIDSHKDVIGRVSIKQAKLSPFLISGGASILYGGMEQFTNEVYRMEKGTFRLDDNPANVGKIAPRHYYGADLQIQIPTRVGNTELRAEYITGTQTSTRTSSESPYGIPSFNGGTLAPLFVRPFNGAYFYFLQPIFTERHQLGVKYDWYDPNTAVAGQSLGEGFTGADVTFRTLGMGYNYYINDNLRLMLWYDRVKNEETRLPGYTQDLDDDVFTCRLQFRF
ncbi:hypothetical protein HNQ92_003628 [Rhabdobacter roseus]|uniref:Porin n=2 Tax=Rhabdobacter roseus TaxID=1655419 RepID=A0A840TP12_9BACT|nr:hypothetical protein [Rhabdobacter roseus]